MIISINHSGQLCNLLWSLWPQYSFAFKSKTILHVFFFERKYLAPFSDYLNDENIRFHCILNKPLPSFVKTFIHFICLFETRSDLRFLSNSKFRIFLINGWNHHNDLSFNDNIEARDSFVKAFSFRDDVKNRVVSFLLPLKNDNTVVVGVHIRRGDYRQWHNGRYCYSDEVWVRYMNQILLQLKGKGLYCEFVVCSNEDVQIKDDNLSGRIHSIPDSDGITDLCALSMCDKILAPPSTFSQWASFINNVPLYIVLSPNEKIDLDKFAPIISQDSFADGRFLKCENGEAFSIL